METDVDRDNVRWSIGNFNNPPGIWPSYVPGEGSVRVCGDTVLLEFWCGFAGIFVLSCGIVVLQNQAVCGIKKFSSKFQSGLRFSHVFLCGVCT